MSNSSGLRSPLAVCAGIALVGMGVCGALVITADQTQQQATVQQSTPTHGDPDTRVACPTEDSVNCYWDATLHGNGAGRSFTVDPDGSVHYLDGGK